MTKDELQEIIEHDARAGDNLQAAPPAWLHRRLLLDHIRQSDEIAQRIAVLLGVEARSLSDIEKAIQHGVPLTDSERACYSPLHEALPLVLATESGWVCRRGFTHPIGEVCMHHWGEEGEL